MLKIKNLTEEKEADTEFWLEEDKDGGGILIKAKIIGVDGFTEKQMGCLVAKIDKKGLLIYDGVGEGLGFETVKDNLNDYALSHIRVRYAFES